MNDIFRAYHYFLTGFSLITKPGVKRYVIIPLIINLLIYGAMFLFAMHFIANFNAWFEALLPHWLQWLSILIWLLFVFAFFLIFIFTFVIVANIVAAPFNSLLAEKIALLLTGQIIPQRSLFDNLKDIPRIIGRQLAMLGYYLPRAFVLLILFFIPFFQFIAAPLWFFFNGWFMSVTYLDYPSDNDRVSFQQMLTWLRARRALALTFGFCILGGAMIPGLNLVIMPVAVAGATACWVREYQRKPAEILERRLT